MRDLGELDTGITEKLGEGRLPRFLEVQSLVVPSRWWSHWLMPGHMAGERRVESQAFLLKWTVRP